MRMPPPRLRSWVRACAPACIRQRARPSRPLVATRAPARRAVGAAGGGDRRVHRARGRRAGGGRGAAVGRPRPAARRPGRPPPRCRPRRCLRGLASLVPMFHVCLFDFEIELLAAGASPAAARKLARVKALPLGGKGSQRMPAGLPPCTCASSTKGGAVPAARKDERDRAAGLPRFANHLLLAE